MKVHYDIAALPNFTKSVITIGTFDGVHIGHCKIIAQLKAEAAAIGGESVLITFHPHPRSVVGDTSGVKLITTLDEKLSLLEQQGVDHVVIVPFNDAFANQSAEAYIESFLFRRFNPAVLIIGYDHRFGKGRSGDYKLLEAFGSKLGFAVKEIPEAVLQESAISSTRIRKALLHADLAVANALLGYPYFFQGEVIKGDQLGRTIGYPTANIQMNSDEKLVPGDGVYAVAVHLPATTQDLYGMMYIGSRPVVNGKRRVIEVNIFDFEADIYGQNISIQMVQYLRGDIHFNGLESLQAQLAIDKVAAMKVFALD